MLTLDQIEIIKNDELYQALTSKDILDLLTFEQTTRFVDVFKACGCSSKVTLNTVGYTLRKLVKHFDFETEIMPLFTSNFDKDFVVKTFLKTLPKYCSIEHRPLKEIWGQLTGELELEQLLEPVQYI